MINRGDVEGYFQEGCADEARSLAVRHEKRKTLKSFDDSPLSLSLCDSTINNHLFLIYAALYYYAFSFIVPL